MNDRPGLADVREVFVFLAENFLWQTNGAPPHTPLSLTGIPSDWDEREYHALFSGTRFPSLALWESCYLGKEENRRLLNGVTLSAADAYRQAGLHADEKFKQPPDHIGIECAFFAFLCSNGTGEQRAAFLEKHLRPFAVSFAAALEKHAEPKFYKALADTLRKAADKAGKNITELSGLREAAQAEARVPIGLRALRADESDEPNAAAQVPICGISDCGSRCPLTAEVSGGCVLRVRQSAHPDARLRKPSLDMCPKGAFYDRTFLSGARLRYPMMRTGARGEGRFRRITWDEATDAIASEIRRIGQKYGPQSRYVHYSTGVDAAARGDLFAKNLLALDGGYLNRHNSYSTACTAAATPYTYGTPETGNSAKDLLNSKLIILWGHNPMETHFGAFLKHYLREAKERGIPIIVVDPRFSDTASELGARWIGLRPGTDGALADAMAYVIFDEGLQDQNFMDRFCLGFDAWHMPPGMETCENYRDYAGGRYDGTPKTPEWAAPLTGVDAETIRWLARTYAAAKPAALLHGWGPQRHGNGEQTVRSGTMLTCLTGNVGIPGGSAAGSGYVRQRPELSLRQIPNPYKGSIPVFLWTDAVLRGGSMTAEDGLRGVDRLESGVKMIFNLAGNALVSQHSDAARTGAILRDTSLCEFIVCSDLFLTPSAKYADILLPGTSLFEGENAGSPWREGDYVLYCNKSIEPLFECRFEYDWLSDVARKLGLYDQFTQGGKDLRGLLEESYGSFARGMGAPDGGTPPGFDAFRKDGIYRFPEEPPFVAFEKNIQNPERYPFPTPSGKIEIFSPRLHAMNRPYDIPAIPKYVPGFEGVGGALTGPTGKYPFQLIGWHSKRRVNSTHDNNSLMDRLEPHRVWIHPLDAESRNIRDGGMADIFNDRGRMRIKAYVTDKIVRGVLAVPQGGWHTPSAGGADLRGMNVLSAAIPTPLAKGNPQHSNLVDIAPYSEL